MEADYAVNERWKLRNGSVAVITQREKGITVGHIEGRVALLIWEWRKATAGVGYDMLEQLEPASEAASGGEKQG